MGALNYKNIFSISLNFTTYKQVFKIYLPEVVLTQFVSPDDEHDVLETCGELNTKINT